MNSTRKVFVGVGLLLAALVLLPALASAQGLKVGYVDDEKLQLNYRAFQRAQEQWEIEARAWDEEARAKNEELRTMIDDYEKQRLILSDEKREEREAAIRTKQEALDAYTRQIYGPEGTAERRQRSLIEPIQQAVTQAIEAVALEENFDVVFTLAASGLAYIKETYDITDKVLQKLEEIQ